MISYVINRLELARRQIVLRHVQGRYLDIGCGLNHAVRDYRGRGGDGIGLDVYDFGGADLLLQDTTDLPFPTSSFDTISFIACLNHIPHRETVLREANRLLKPDGKLLITMIPPRLSAFWHWFVRRWDDDQTERGMKEGEVWGLSAGEIRRLLTDAGLTLIEHRRFVVGLNNLYISRKRCGTDPSIV